MYDQKLLVTGRGTVGKLELRNTPNSQVLNIFLLSNRSVKRGDNYEQETDKNSVIVWGNYAETLHRNLAVGDSVLVNGWLEDENWTAEDGSPRTAKKIRAFNVEITRKKNANGSSPEPQQAAAERVPVEDDVPF